MKSIAAGPLSREETKGRFCKSFWGPSFRFFIPSFQFLGSREYLPKPPFCHREIKCPRSGFRSGGTSERTLVPGIRGNIRQNHRVTLLETILLGSSDFGNHPFAKPRKSAHAEGQQLQSKQIQTSDATSLLGLCCRASVCHNGKACTSDMWHLELPEMKAEVLVVALLRLPRKELKGSKGHTRKGHRENTLSTFPYALCGYALCTFSKEALCHFLSSI